MVVMDNESQREKGVQVHLRSLEKVTADIEDSVGRLGESLVGVLCKEETTPNCDLVEKSMYSCDLVEKIARIIANLEGSRYKIDALIARLEV